MRNITRDIRLDVLRFIAVFLVLGRHTYGILYKLVEMPAEQRTMSESFFVLWQRIGWVGVDLFFVISGFLISDLIFKNVKKGGFSFKKFFIRREFKIYPPFLLLIIVTIVFFKVRHHPFSYINVLKELFFVQNYTQGLWNHTWSLAVEEHFYILLPLLIIFLYKKNAIKILPAVLIGVSVTVLVVRILHVKYYVGNYNEADFYLPTHLRIDSFIPGVLIAYFKNFSESRYNALLKINRLWYLAFFVVAMVFLWNVPEMNFWMLTFGLTIISVGFAALLLLFLATDRSKFDKWAIFRGMAIIGKDSYSIYLWHMCVMYWGVSALYQASHIKFPMYIIIPLYMVTSVIIGVVMAMLIEQPVLKFRDKYFPSYTTKNS